MTDYEPEESVPASRTGTDDNTEEERHKCKSGSAPSQTAQEPQNDPTTDTVPRSQYRRVLDRLGTLEKKMKMADKSVGWDSDDGSSDSDSAIGPWIGPSMMSDIRFMLRAAKSNRRAWKRGTKANDAVLQRTRDAKKIRDNLLGGQGQNAAQLLFGGSKARPTYLNWSSFSDEIQADSVPLLEPINVLMEEPNVFNKSNYEKAIDVQQYDENEHVPRDPTSRYFPERIRINSWFLRNALNEAIVEESQTVVEWESNGIIFLRPFKYLVHYEPQLRAYSEQLRKKVHEHTEAESSVLLSVADLSAQKKDNEIIAENPPIDLSRSGGSSGASSEEPPEREIVAESTHTDEDGGRKSDGQSEHDRKKVQGVLENSATLLHLECLLELLDTIVKPRMDAVASNDDHLVSFGDLWNLFKPGDIVLEQGEKQAYRLIQVITPQHRATPPWARWLTQDDSSDSEDESDDNPLRLECVFLDFDGVQFGPVSKSFKIPRYEGRKSIKSFPVYGLRFSTNPDVRQQLVARGRVLLDVATYQSMYYTGLALETKEEIDSQVVVDFSEALSVSENKAWMPQISPVSTGKKNKRYSCYADCCRNKYVHDDDEVDQKRTAAFIQTLLPQQALGQPPLTIHPKSWTDMKKEEYSPDDDELIIMTYRVFAFVLRSRKWAQLDLTDLRYDNKENRESIETAFNRLVLPDGHKEMVKALVTQHFNGRTVAPMGGIHPDLIRGKGKGLIVLLHGAPGVGKTTTAEGVAEEFKRPLFQITCGDLGTTPVEVQTELEKNFSLASKWGCVLLLDEADVFLAQRERKDLTRNALVAIFLRILEYYTGILFLTTNRVGDFDEAFASRIHMSLHYPALNADKTKKVFELNIDLIKERMRQQDRKLTIDEDAILDFAEAHYKDHRYGRWNGRQIRNACQTALALAEFEAKQDVVFLRPKHFKKVQQAYLDFSRYLGETFGTYGDQRAHESQLRAEEHDYAPPETGSSITRAEPSGQPSHVALSPFRPTGRQQPAPMQQNQSAYGAYPSMQSPQGGQYMPSNQPPRASQPQMGSSGHEQFGQQPQTWAAQPPMAQSAAQYPYQQPSQLQPPYQQHGFVMQGHQQATDPNMNASGNTDV